MSLGFGSVLAIFSRRSVSTAAVLGDWRSLLSIRTISPRASFVCGSGSFGRRRRLGVVMRAAAKIKQRLGAAQPRIDAVAREQLGVGTDLRQAALVHQADHAGVLNRR